MKKITTLCLCATMALAMQAQDFNDYFENKTLRTDYIFTGDSQKQEVYLDELSSLPEWAGRRHHLNQLPLAGNGEITMTDKASGKVIYRTSFSSLFQEWLGEEEATRVKKGYENSFLLPFPKQEAIVTVSLKNAHQEVCASLTHEIRPDDILIHQRGLTRITPHRYMPQSCSIEN